MPKPSRMRVHRLSTPAGSTGLATTTVEVALDFGVLAPLPRVQLLRSSGRQALDAQALDMLSQAAAVAALPDGLKARDFRLVLAVQFSLDDDQ